jgi:hypothetical protein
MKKLLIIFCFLPLGLSAQETTYRYFSFTEFFKMIEDEPNDTFVLKNAIIEKDTITDKAYLGKIVGGVGNYEPIRKDTIFIKKTLNLENVHFDPIRGSNRKYFGILNHLVFLEPVSFTRLRIDVNESINEIRPTDFKNIWLYLQLNECTINDITLITQSATEEELKSRNAGIHEVYLEEKKQDLLGYEEFKSIITNSEKSVPRFFSVTALPLYQWAVSGTQISAKILSKVDILKGTWEDLPAGQKAWKSFLLVGGFLIALVYDLLIKVLNALMLSINTFTTLGFGEIPIKGLPRYLAIIQGFIGWFMLTIFSVSLISQLLN